MKFIKNLLLLFVCLLLVHCAGTEGDTGEEDYYEEGEGEYVEGGDEEGEYEEGGDEEVIEEEWEEESEDESLADSINEYKARYNQKEAQVKQMEKEINQYKQRMLEYDNQLAGGRPKKGLYYRIQLGARLVSDGGLGYGEVSRIMGDDILNEGGYDKIRIGYYNTFSEAKMAEYALKRAGIRDTWIVPMLNGNRISVKQATSAENYRIPLEAGQNVESLEL